MQFGFLEFKSVEMTTACLALDGMFMAGSQLRVRRPNDFNHAAPLPVTVRSRRRRTRGPHHGERRR